MKNYKHTNFTEEVDMYTNVFSSREEKWLVRIAAVVLLTVVGGIVYLEKFGLVDTAIDYFTN